MDSFTNTIWLILVIASSAVSIFGSLLSGELGLKLYAFLSPFLWAFNVTFMLTWADDFNMKVLALSVWQLIVHIIISPYIGKRAILVSSSSLVITMSLNQWGSDAFEVAAFTACVEVATWIISYFILTVRSRILR